MVISNLLRRAIPGPRRAPRAVQPARGAAVAEADAAGSSEGLWVDPGLALDPGVALELESTRAEQDVFAVRAPRGESGRFADGLEPLDAAFPFARRDPRAGVAARPEARPAARPAARPRRRGAPRSAILAGVGVALVVTSAGAFRAAGGATSGRIAPSSTLDAGAQAPAAAAAAPAPPAAAGGPASPVAAATASGPGPSTASSVEVGAASDPAAAGGGYRPAGGERLHAGRTLAWWNDRLATLSRSGEEGVRLRGLTLRRAIGVGLRERAGAPGTLEPDPEAP